MTAARLDVDGRLGQLAAEYRLPATAAASLGALLEAVAAAPVSLTSVRDPRAAADVHVADSLCALALPQLADAQRVADLGSGAGFPGLPLSIALPGAEVTLLESVRKKCAFLSAVIADLGLGNARVVPGRVEEWTSGRGTQDVVCARAVAPLATLVEYAAPLLRPGGTLIAWKGEPGEEEVAAGDRCAALAGMQREAVVGVSPFSGSQARSLYVYTSVSSPPKHLPRRAGMARKRPLGT